MPAPWAKVGAKSATYRNRLAPGGPSPVKSASLQYGKLARVTASALGGLDISTPPGPGGVMTVLTVENAADGSRHRMCSLYRAASGSVVQHRVTASGYRLTARGGVEVACPSCVDGVQNGDESDVDCGGPDAGCERCATGGSCNAATDCASGVCTDGVCRAPACDDGVENGAETDADCGGPGCADCPAGDACLAPGDCQSGVCVANVCQAPTCSDGVANAAETDVDCGGPACPDCGPGAACLGAGDCQSGVCSGGACQAAACDDGVQNGGETGLDCGGPCADCGTGGGCVGGGDCQSGVCVGNVCQAPTCSDGVANGGETDVDCGGPSCADCALNRACVASGDCQTNYCTGGRCKCPSQLFTFQVTSSTGGLFTAAVWPGGTATQSGPPGCSVTINRPDDIIHYVCTIAAPFSVRSFAGYSTCFGTGGEDGDGCQPVSCPPAGIGSCCSGRPSCSAALNGSGSARYFVQCNP
ncbi:MAG: hypothetical protein AB1689_25740 [Thermodesulfobacteriota bacterium]